MVNLFGEPLSKGRIEALAVLAGCNIRKYIHLRLAEHSSRHLYLMDKSNSPMTFNPYDPSHWKDRIMIKERLSSNDIVCYELSDTQREALAEVEMHLKLSEGSTRLNDSKKDKISVSPLVNYSASEIKQIRIVAGMSQAIFAAYMGVSLKTVEAWEAGRNTPSGPACRLLALTRANPNFPVISGIMRE